MQVSSSGSSQDEPARNAANAPEEPPGPGGGRNLQHHWFHQSQDRRSFVPAEPVQRAWLISSGHGWPAAAEGARYRARYARGRRGPGPMNGGGRVIVIA
jgi:hypothetical protein